MEFIFTVWSVLGAECERRDDDDDSVRSSEPYVRQHSTGGSPQVVRWAWGMRMTPEPGRIHQLGRQTAHLIACRRLIERYAVPGVLDYKQVSVLLRLSRG